MWEATAAIIDVIQLYAEVFEAWGFVAFVLCVCVCVCVCERGKCVCVCQCVCVCTCVYERRSAGTCAIRSVSVRLE